MKTKHRKTPPGTIQVLYDCKQGAGWSRLESGAALAPTSKVHPFALQPPRRAPGAPRRGGQLESASSTLCPACKKGSRADRPVPRLLIEKKRAQSPTRRSGHAARPKGTAHGGGRGGRERSAVRGVAGDAPPDAGSAGRLHQPAPRWTGRKAGGGAAARVSLTKTRLERLECERAHFRGRRAPSSRRTQGPTQVRFTLLTPIDRRSWTSARRTYFDTAAP